MQKPGHPYVFVEVEGEVAPGIPPSPSFRIVAPLAPPDETDTLDLEDISSESDISIMLALQEPAAIPPLDAPCEQDDTTVEVEIPKNPPAPPQLLRGLEEAHERAGFDVKTLLQGLGGTSLLLVGVFCFALVASLASSESGSTPAPADEGTLERVGWWLMETGPVAVAEVSHV